MKELTTTTQDDEEWTDDFDFSFSGLVPTTNVESSQASSSGEEEDWDALFDDDDDAGATAAAAVAAAAVEGDLHHLRQLIVDDLETSRSSLDSNDSDDQTTTECTSTATEDASLLRSLRHAVRQRAKLSQTPRSKIRASRNEATAEAASFTYSPSLSRRSGSNGSNGSNIKTIMLATATHAILFCASAFSSRSSISSISLACAISSSVTVPSWFRS